MKLSELRSLKFMWEGKLLRQVVKDLALERWSAGGGKKGGNQTSVTVYCGYVA
jgi:hypothetical protein